MRSKVLLGALYVFSVALANWLTTRYGFWPVGFGLSATAGTYAAGLTLSLRDVAQDAGGRAYVVLLIAVGGLLSFLVADPAIALASVVAFTVSELADWSVYQPLRARSWTGAVLASNLVGAVVDSCLFLGIAFGVDSIGHALPGQLLGKLWVTLGFLAVVWVVRRLTSDVPVRGQAH